jgi:hypothetical protein
VRGRGRGEIKALKTNFLDYFRLEIIDKQNILLQSVG